MHASKQNAHKPNAYDDISLNWWIDFLVLNGKLTKRFRIKP